MLNKNRFILNGILVLSIVSLSIAYFIQYILGHKPCNLCLIERIPYIASAILVALIFIINKFERFIAIIILLFFVCGAIVSFYHVGIEQGFFSESLLCNIGNGSENLTKEDLLKQLSQNSISCKDVSFNIFGISLAAINTIFSIVLSVIFVKLFISYEKN